MVSAFMALAGKEHVRDEGRTWLSLQVTSDPLFSGVVRILRRFENTPLLFLYCCFIATGTEYEFGGASCVTD